MLNLIIIFFGMEMVLFPTFDGLVFFILRARLSLLDSTDYD